MNQGRFPLAVAAIALVTGCNPSTRRDSHSAGSLPTRPSVADVDSSDNGASATFIGSWKVRIRPASADAKESGAESFDDLLSFRSDQTFVSDAMKGRGFDAARYRASRGEGLMAIVIATSSAGDLARWDLHTDSANDDRIWGGLVLTRNGGKVILFQVNGTRIARAATRSQ
jgi:hypothetical protein